MSSTAAAADAPASSRAAAPAHRLYVHLPFCSSRCGYCAFVVETDSLSLRDAYLDAVCREATQASAHMGALDTVYLGGGTPTLMRPRRIARLLDHLRPQMAPACEVSIEANPETIDRAAIAALVDAGVTRMSLGVQSFQPHLLRALQRQATPAQAVAAVRCARAEGVRSVSIDLLFGVPGQTDADIEADIAQAIALGVDHISWYELEIKPGTVLQKIGTDVPDEDAVADQYIRIVAALEDAGYDWYETANFARPGHACRHNTGYWRGEPYIGLGVGAVSTHAGTRWRNAPGVARYIAALAAGDPAPHAREHLDRETLRRERWMLGLRLRSGVDLDVVGPPDHPDQLDDLVEAGMVVREGRRVRLAHHARFVHNAVAVRLMDFAA